MKWNKIKHNMNWRKHSEGRQWESLFLVATNCVPKNCTQSFTFHRCMYCTMMLYNVHWRIAIATAPLLNIHRELALELCDNGRVKFATAQPTQIIHIPLWMNTLDKFDMQLCYRFRHRWHLIKKSHHLLLKWCLFV